MSEGPTILFEDNHCLAVNKPAGLLTQGVPAGLPTLEAQVKDYLRQRYGKPGNVYLGIPHRLDRPVSGVVVFARNTKAARRLAEQFQKRQVTKRYWALVEGEVTPPEGRWEDWLRKLPEEARAEPTGPDDPAGKLAVLDYRQRATGAGGTLLEVQPLTGRMHQIRVQAASRGWPIRGDTLYGARLPFGPAAETARDRTIALHACCLTFLHPIRYEPVCLCAPLPPAWNDLGIALPPSTPLAVPEGPARPATP